MPEIEFSNPHLRKVRRVIEYELHGVAFVKGYEKTVGFTFECQSAKNWRLIFEDLYQAKDVYYFFRNLFKNCLDEDLGMQKSFSTLYTEWMITERHLQEVLDRIEKAMGSNWRDAFKTLITVYEKQK